MSKVNPGLAGAFVTVNEIAFALAVVALLISALVFGAPVELIRTNAEFDGVL